SNVNGYEIENLPIPIPTDCSQISEIVKTILNLKKDNISTDISYYENQIDKLVYYQYGLNYDEILIVDPETPISREEYDNFMS
ncbi:MAG: hypothetical protein K2H44_05820, partial [Muribaculaceae bacterium]|nr:hypothetical protein [Muribaculaceae bacterium]